MASKLSVSEDSAARMRSGDGLILGLADEGSNSVTVVGAVPMPLQDAAREALADLLPGMVPGGVTGVGHYFPVGGSFHTTTSEAFLKACVLARHHGSDLQFLVAREVVEPRMVSTSNDGSVIVPGFTTFRCHADVCLQVLESAPAYTSDTSTAIDSAIDQLKQDLFGHSQVFITDARPHNSRIIISRSTQDSVSTALGATTAIISCSLLHCTCPASSDADSGASSSTTLPTAPVFDYQPLAAPSQLTSVPLGLDVLCYVPNSAKLGDAALAFQEALLVQLEAARNRLQAQAADPSAPDRVAAAAAAAAAVAAGAGGKAGPEAATAGAAALVPLRAHHFAPPGLGHHVTLLYPNLGPNPEAAEAELLPMRQAAHAALGLPSNVPMLRFANALNLDSDDSSAASTSGRGARLRNVHGTLQAPGIGGQTYLVNGLYEYYHYMQDRFNDNGWGCAYRSLQTICSWFVLQRYTNKPVPTHRDIQQLLVRIGDKEPSFIGSSQWIGAIELSYILDEYLGVTCKIITVNRGSDMPSAARELAAHFEGQGTPVMIGGGVLAYTLLGVQFNEQTGEAAFLILDPHYTGGEDLGKIVQGTWVGWKKLGDAAAAGGPLFVANAFYNLLCPVRPSTV